MSLPREKITHLAHLAGLKIAEDEIDSYAQQLSRILDLVEMMQKIDTEGITPMAHPQENALRLRADQVNAHDQREQYQQIAPATAQGLYLTPKVIEQA